MWRSQRPVVDPGKFAAHHEIGNRSDSQRHAIKEVLPLVIKISLVLYYASRRSSYEQLNQKLQYRYSCPNDCSEVCCCTIPAPESEELQVMDSNLEAAIISNFLM